MRDICTHSLCLEIDGEVLTSLLQNMRGQRFEIAELNQPGLHLDISNKVERIRGDKDQIALKASLLRRGLHYWLRENAQYQPEAQASESPTQSNIHSLA